MTLRITLYNNDGTVAKRYTGPSKRQLKRAHQRGTCNAFCSYCYEEGCKMMADQKGEPLMGEIIGGYGAQA